MAAKKASTKKKPEEKEEGVEDLIPHFRDNDHEDIEPSPDEEMHAVQNCFTEKEGIA